MFGFTALFNKMLDNMEKSRNAAARSHMALCAIEHRDVLALRHVLAQGPIPHQTNILLDAALKTDDVGIFDVVLSQQAQSDPNTVLCSGAGSWVSMSQSSAPLIYRAIQDNKPNIALYLAKSPALDMTAPGGSSYIYCSAGIAGSGYGITEKSPYSTPLEAAREKKMDPVVAVLNERMAAKALLRPNRSI